MNAAYSIVLLLTLPLGAFTPVLNRVDPPGGQRGTVVDVRFHGERLEEIDNALFYEPGLSLSELRTKDGKLATAKLSIAADAAPGEHSLRLTGPGGFSELRTFWVSAFPTVREIEPNGINDPAQRIDLNRTVHGVAGNEDDDCFLVTLKKGQRLSAEVEAMRLGRTMFDASLAILDARGFELATCDDAPLLRTDAFLSILAPEDGDYRVVVREAAYEGNEQCQYRLHIGGFPRPKAVFPTGGRPGETLEFTFIGDPSGPIRQTFTLPSEPRVGHPLFPMQDGLSAPSPHWITVSPLESARDGAASNSPGGVVTLPPIPCAAQGVIDEGKPADWFRFTAKKGESLVFRAMARALRSPLDPVLSIHQADRKFIVANDDQVSPDSLIDWTCPNDGDYLLQIRDHLKRSGPDFTYRIEITGRTPSIRASLPIVERGKSQKWKTFPVSRGGRYAAVVNVTRINTGGDLVFEAVSLPRGVTLHAPHIPRSVNSFPVVFEAAPDAPQSAGLYAFRIRSVGESPPLTGDLIDTIQHVEVNNEGVYHSGSFDRIAAGVIKELPFKVDLAAPSVPIVKNGNLVLKIRVARQRGFAGKITLRFPWSPPGISGPVSVEIPGDKSEADYELNASGDAVPGDWQVCVAAEAATPEGPVLTSTALTPLKVAEPYVSLALDLAAAETGSSAVMRAKIECLRTFRGAAKAELYGLPQGVSSKPQSFTADQTEITFPLTIAADARTGKHSGLFCLVGVPENECSIMHRTAQGGTLRIDAPEAKQAGAPAPPSGGGPASVKPLSRLEQLRQKK